MRACIIRREISQVFPRKDGEEKRRFDLLKDAYKKARYKRKSYHITKEDFDYLVPRVALLRDLVKQFCDEHLAALKKEVEGIQ